MAYEYGSKLAQFQDMLITKVKAGGSITREETLRLMNNSWIDWAAKTAPNNLVVRQWCLIDISNGSETNKARIEKICDTLAYVGRTASPIWAEGYSYWRYTREALDLYVARFNNVFVTNFITVVEQNFMMTGYIRNNMLYPAPFGDLRDQPIVGNPSVYLKDNFAGPVQKKGDYYDVASWPLGFNAHIPSAPYKIQIINGLPYVMTSSGTKPFTWYQGYDKKYDSKWAELWDQFNWNRIKSAISMLFKRK